MDDLEFLQKLASSGPPRRIQSESLQLLGKQAASAFVSHEAPSLTHALHEVVSRNPELSPDQVQRVGEFANQETFKSLFVDGRNTNVQFEPADAGVVIGGMAAKPSEVQLDALEGLDFLGDVPKGGLPDVDLREVFGLPAESPEYEALNPLHGNQVAVEKTASAVDLARYGVDRAASMLAEAGETFYGMVKKAHLDEGYGILQISKAISLAVEDPTYARDVMQGVATRLEREGVRFDQQTELQKVAHTLVVNHEHPLLQAAANLERCAIAFYRSDLAHEKLAGLHQQAVRELQAKARKR